MAKRPKNFRLNGVTVIGGKLTIKSGAELEIQSGASLSGLPKSKYMSDAGSDVSTVAGLRTEYNELLAKLRAAGLMAAAPTIAFATQPADLSLTAGSIDAEDKLTCGATVSDGSTPSYQWNSNTSESNEGGSAVNGATSASYVIPSDTAAGTYYYYCVASYEGVILASEAVTVTVASAG